MSNRRGSRHGIDRDEWLLRSREFVRRGNDLPHSKVNPAIVREIRANRMGWPDHRWASSLGLHVRTINKIRTRETWAHVA
jgi:hypothetical protein